MIKSKEATKKNCLHPPCLFVQIYCDSPTQLKTMESEEVIEKNKLNKFAITLLLICSNLFHPPPPNHLKTMESEEVIEKIIICLDPPPPLFFVQICYEPPPAPLAKNNNKICLDPPTPGPDHPRP